MSYSLVNVSSTEALPERTVLRVTFSKSDAFLSSINPLALNDSQFASHINSIYEQLIAHGFAMVSPNPSIRDGQPAVIDLRLTSAAVLSDIATTLDGIAGYFVNVSRIEKLSDAAASVAASNEGASEREATKATQAKADDSSSFLGRLSGFLGVAEHVLIAVVISLVIGAVLIYGKEIKSYAKKLTK